MSCLYIITHYISSFSFICYIFISYLVEVYSGKPLFGKQMRNIVNEVQHSTE